MITASLSLPMSVLTALGAAVGYFFAGRPEAAWELLPLAFYGLLTGGLVAIAVAGWQFYRTLFPKGSILQTYQFLPLPAQLEELAVKLRGKVAEVPDLATSAADFYARTIIERLQHCINRNAIINDSRSVARHRGIRATMIAALFLASAMFPFFAQAATQQKHARSDNIVSMGGQTYETTDQS